MTEVVAILGEFRREKLDLLLRHEAGARLVGGYDANNAYQYIVNRDELHLTWLSDALAGLGGALEAEPPRTDRAIGGAKGEDVARRVLEEDARDGKAFVERWRPRVEALTNARCRGMLRVVLGETLEQVRTFEQGLSGRTDMLGSRPAKAGPRVGSVLSTRWVE